jgi:hypothetical protein
MSSKSESKNKKKEIRQDGLHRVAYPICPQTRFESRSQVVDSTHFKLALGPAHK